MRWMLVERKPDVVYAGRPDLYLGKDDAETTDRARALTFESREAAEAHRRRLDHPYDWVATTTES
ncbi:MAG: hypothetical protein JSR99_01420 [Proteobacteria bacterium]|nr:hypothetical protein [Pseudomonadota bacterium]